MALDELFDLAHEPGERRPERDNSWEDDCSDSPDDGEEM